MAGLLSLFYIYCKCYIMLLHKRNFTLHCTRCTVEKVWAWFFLQFLKKFIIVRKTFLCYERKYNFSKIRKPKILYSANLSEGWWWLCTVPKLIDFPRYNMKCSGENAILRGIFHVVSCFPLHFMLYLGNLDYFSDSVQLKRINSGLVHAHFYTHLLNNRKIIFN